MYIYSHLIVSARRRWKSSSSYSKCVTTNGVLVDALWCERTRNTQHQMGTAHIPLLGSEKFTGRRRIYETSSRIRWWDAHCFCCFIYGPPVGWKLSSRGIFINVRERICVLFVLAQISVCFPGGRTDCECKDVWRNMRNKCDTGEKCDNVLQSCLKLRLLRRNVNFGSFNFQHTLRLNTICFCAT